MNDVAVETSICFKPLAHSAYGSAVEMVPISTMSARTWGESAFNVAVPLCISIIGDRRHALPNDVAKIMKRPL